MELISNSADIFRNIEYLEQALVRRDRRALALIKRGTCFVAYGQNDLVKFAPSRFIGYQDNTFEGHTKNQSKDGRETNPAISEALGSHAVPSEELELAYANYCRSLGFEPNEKGSFGVERKYWDQRK